MAKKRTKKQAKARIPRLPTLPPSVVPLLGPLAPPYVIGKSAEIIADELIELDPLNRLSNGNGSMATVARAVNDPNIQMDAELMALINDPSVVMANNGEILRRDTSQFKQLAQDLRATPVKKKRKKNPQLSRAFEKANEMGRKKKGGFKKGWDQAKIASTAHRLVRLNKI